LSRRLKLEVESADLRESWRELQTVGPATQKALSPNLFLVRGTM